MWPPQSGAAKATRLLKVESGHSGGDRSSDTPEKLSPCRFHHPLASALGQCGIFAALGPAVTLIATLGSPLASLLRHKSKRVGHGAGFTRVHAHPRPFASHDTTEASCGDASEGLEPQKAGPTGHGPC